MFSRKKILKIATPLFGVGLSLWNFNSYGKQGYAPHFAILEQLLSHSTPYRHQVVLVGELHTHKDFIEELFQMLCRLQQKVPSQYLFFSEYHFFPSTLILQNPMGIQNCLLLSHGLEHPRLMNLQILFALLNKDFQKGALQDQAGAQWFGGFLNQLNINSRNLGYPLPNPLPPFHTVAKDIFAKHHQQWPYLAQKFQEFTSHFDNFTPTSLWGWVSTRDSNGVYYNRFCYEFIQRYLELSGEIEKFPKFKMPFPTDSGQTHAFIDHISNVVSVYSKDIVGKRDRAFCRALSHGLDNLPLPRPIVAQLGLAHILGVAKCLRFLYPAVELDITHYSLGGQVQRF